GNICYCFGSGVASVALLLAAMFYSDEDRTAIHTLVKTQVHYAVLLDAALVVLVLALAPVLVGLFLTDPAARTMAIHGLRLFSLSLLPCSLNTTFKNFYQGVNRTRFTELISLLQNVTFPVAVAFLLSRFWGTTGVWLSFLGGELLTMGFICAVVWVKNGKASLSAETFAMLPRLFGVKPKDMLEMTIRSQAEAADASMKAEAFCRERGESPRNSMLISLCVDEMVNNIVTHGFKKERKDQSVDVRIFFKDGNRIIRIRDNCVNFDPLEYLELHKTDDPAAHIGIRMVMKMVKNANYVNSLGLNNLTLVL
ncbi:MAG: ATP-binding protein, partial [Clostridia bacterium]|nr:ATP-binding protein [Clostridia bacterium]